MSAAAPEPRLGLRGRIGRQLGADLLENIFARLDAKQLAAAELTCRHWYTAAHLFSCCMLYEPRTGQEENASVRIMHNIPGSC